MGAASHRSERAGASDGPGPHSSVTVRQQPPATPGPAGATAAPPRRRPTGSAQTLTTSRHPSQGDVLILCVPISVSRPVRVVAGTRRGCGAGVVEHGPAADDALPASSCRGQDRPCRRNGCPPSGYHIGGRGQILAGEPAQGCGWRWLGRLVLACWAAGVGCGCPICVVICVVQPVGCHGMFPYRGEMRSGLKVGPKSVHSFTTFINSKKNTHRTSV